ncbi:unnamed protein product [Caenorhabditis auriculariae]|uniref:Carboxypeptidase n=1 Tax=Caenorhabditis auriculariae TaxID=2777116 RepID=A0A8S1HGU3_9PELO|nr:unnamed protein product [Caenorhabditis auriculariae]
MSVHGVFVTGNNRTRDASIDIDRSGSGGTNFKVYSGYVAANDAGNWQMHYTLTESKSNPDKDPLLVWFNGGPGCSSLGGLFEELGPFYVNYDGATLYENPYAWNAKANVLYLESPIGVGFSYDTKTANFSSANDDQTAAQNFLALKNFFLKAQPKYANRPFYLSGESYAGIYIPMLTDLLVQAINNNTFPNTNFKGSAIGNGFMNVKVLMNALVQWSAYHGRISVQDWNYVKANCSKGADVDSFDFTQYTYTRNGMDYFGDNSTCGGIIQSLISQNYNGDEGFDQYNFYQECYDKSVFQAPPPPSAPGKRPRNRAFQGTSSLNSNTAALVNRFSNDNQWAYFCWNEDAVYAYLNTPAVQDALNIPQTWRQQNNGWVDCRDSIYNSYKLKYDKTNDFFNRIIKNTKSDFRFLVYNGDVDTVCNYLGDARHIAQVASDNGLTTNKRKAWFYSDNQQLAGYYQTYSGKSLSGSKVLIDVVTVKGAGHMVPYDRAGPSVQMITNFLFPSANGSVDYTSSSNFNTNIKLAPMVGGNARDLMPLLSTVFAVLLAKLLF